MILVVYGSLGFLRLKLSKRIGFPGIWDKRVTNRQRFLTPLAIGLILGVVLIALDLVLSNFNSIGRLPHPSFPTSVVASISAGIGGGDNLQTVLYLAVRVACLESFAAGE